MLRHKNDGNQFSRHVTTSVITLIILENQVIDSQCESPAHKRWVNLMLEYHCYKSRNLFFTRFKRFSIHSP